MVHVCVGVVDEVPHEVMEGGHILALVKIILQETGEQIDHLRYA